VITKSALKSSSALALALSFPMAAFAQSAPASAPGDQAAPAAAAPETGIGDIVVTAQKREETLQRTAAAVQVISSASLVDRGVTDIVRLQSQVTGLIIQPSRQSVYMFSRGLGQADAQYQTSPAIEMQADGLTLPRSGQQFALFDIGNIQVLKGPQGILYGRYGIGGAVLVGSKRPTFDRMKFEGSFETGNYGLLHGFAAANLPVSDSAGFRVAIDYNKHDGYVTNGENDLDQISGRISFQAKATDRLSIFLSATGMHRRGHGFAQVNFPRPLEANGDPYVVLPVPQTGTVGAANFDDWHNRGFNREESYLFNGELIYDLTDDLKLSYVTGYFSHKGAQVNAFQNKPGSTFVNYASTYYVEDSWDLQNELRLNFEHDGFNVIVGALQHRFEAQDNVVQAAYKAGPLINGPHSPTESNYAVFGDIIVPAGDKLRFELGARQSWDIKHDTGFLSGQPVDINSSNFADFTNFSWKVGAEFDAARHVMVYANVQTGYLPGAYQTATQAVLTNLGLSRRYDSQKVTAYQLGVKSRFLDNRVQLNVEGFYYKYNNFQVTQRVPDPVVPGGFQSPYANIRRSRIYGADIDLNAQVITNGTFTVGLSLLNTRILDSGFAQLAVLQPNGTFQLVADPSLRGYELPFSPKVTLNLGYEQIIPLGNDGKLVGNVGTHHESGKYLDYTRSAVFPGRHPAFWKTDVSLTYKAPGDRWTLSIWGRNLENSATYSAFTPAQLKSAGVVIGSYANVYIDSPRTYGARVGVSF
jgi:iron complex outermembrane receptor protein